MRCHRCGEKKGDYNETGATASFIALPFFWRLQDRVDIFQLP